MGSVQSHKYMSPVCLFFPIQQVFFKHLQCVRQRSRPGVGKQANFGQSSVPVNQVLLEHSPAHLLIHFYGCFQAITTELNSCDRDNTSCKAWDIYFIEKNWVPCSGNWNTVVNKTNKNPPLLDGVCILLGLGER